MPRRGPTSSSYGRSCMGCFKCKCKCIMRPEGHGCERCHRLKKQCQPANTIRRQTIGKTQDQNTRIVELESKLDGLVSLLQSRKVLDGGTEMLPLQRAHVEVTDSVNDAENADSSDDTETVRGHRTFTSPVPALFTMLDAAESTSWATDLDRFRSGMLHYFPFIHLPDDMMSVEHLRRERRHLFSAILCVASGSAPQKRQRAIELKRELCNAAFLPQAPDEEQRDVMDRAIDLLLGLLVYIAWGWDHIRSGGSLSRLMMVAMSLVGEMRLDKLIPNQAHAVRAFTPGVISSREGTNGDGPKQLILERQRALLGCFLLSCFVSAYFGEVETLWWTPRMQAALEALTTSEECATDAVLVLQVRLQLLSLSAVDARGPQEKTDESQNTKHITPLSQLRELRPSIPDAGPATCLPPTAPISIRLLMAHSHYVEVDTIGAMSYSASTVFGHLNIDTLAYFRQCVFAIDACTSGLLALAPSDFVGISFLQWVQLTRCVVVLHHLTLLRDPGWDLPTIRPMVDLPVLLEHMIELLEQTAREAGEEEYGDVFTQLSEVTRQFRSGTEASETQPDQRQSGEDSAQSAASLAPQKGYFRNPRFWLESYFDQAGYSWAGLGTSNPLLPPLCALGNHQNQPDSDRS